MEYSLIKSIPPILFYNQNKGESEQEQVELQWVEFECWQVEFSYQ